MKVRWLRRAGNSLESIVDYIAQDDPAAARRMAVTINTAANSLTEFPERGRVGRIPGTRELVVPGTPYIIPYRIRGEVVQILHVIHSARSWKGKWPK